MEKSNIKKTVRKLMAWLLALAMVIGTITVYPSTEAAAESTGYGITLHYYYDGDAGTPAISFTNECAYDTYDFTYYGRYAYLMEEDGDMGDGWYTFEFEYDYINWDDETGGFQIIASSDGEDCVWDDETQTATDTSTWIESVLYGSDNETFAEDSANYNFYAVLEAYLEENIDVYEGQYYTDIYITNVSIPSSEYGGYDERYTIDCNDDLENYIEWYEDENGDQVDGATYIQYLIALAEELSTTYDYYIGGNQIEDTTNWTEIDAGIFEASWTPVIMTESDEEEGVYYANLGQATDGCIYNFGIYGSLQYKGAFSDSDWNNQVWSAYFTALADAYVQIVYDSVNSTVSINYYEDEDCTVEAEIDYAITTLYFYYTDSYTPTVAFTDSTVTLDDATEAGEYWGRTAYSMTAVDGYENWYSIELSEEYGDFDVVANPSGEDESSSIWLVTLGTTTLDYDEEINVYYQGLIFSSIDEALAYDDWEYDYYIGGNEIEDTTEWTEVGEGIFAESWTPVVMTESDDEEGVYYINLGQATNGSIYSYGIYASLSSQGSFSSSDWNNQVWNAYFTAKADAYVQIIYDSVNSAVTIKYYEDADCTTEVEIEYATTTLYFYYTGSYTPTVVFSDSSVSLTDATEAGEYWGRTAYAMTAVDGYENWYSIEISEEYGDFDVVANPSGEDDSSSIWLASLGSGTIDYEEDVNVYYRGIMFTSLADALAYSDWSYYIAGSNADYDMEAEYNGTSNNIFSNYWAASVGYTASDNSYWSDTESWDDLMTEEEDGVYSILLPNKALEGETYAFNIYTEKDWSENYFEGTQTFTALASAYVSIILDTNTGEYEIEYYADLGISTDAEDAEPSVTGLITEGWGEDEMYVCVTASEISSYYTESAYPVAGIDFINDDDETNSYVFAGWYSYDSENGYEAFTSFPENCEAYAKFVDENVLTAKAQLTSGTDASSETTSIRFVSTVDSLDYDSIGFVLTFNGSTKTTSSTSVYTSLNGSNGTTSFTYAPTIFSSASNYFFAYTIKNVPNTYFDSAFEVTPYWVTKDGTTVYGTERDFVISEIY